MVKIIIEYIIEDKYIKNASSYLMIDSSTSYIEMLTAESARQIVNPELQKIFLKDEIKDFINTIGKEKT